MIKSVVAILSLYALAACGEALAQGKALNNNPNLATLAQQIEAAKITGSCGEGSYLAGIAADGSLICKAFTPQGLTLTTVSQAFVALANTTFEVTVLCPQGEKVTGGGASASQALTGSFPLSDGTGWKIAGKALNAGASGTAYAVCIR